ncbi:TetR/AcrR family transcriptional regulator [Pengzhenrongella sicca]|uniref:TetR/AcrR family transcriptional regulator n=1 Tax=Pengzhenrongella sicca TaxID=2819238 RepID=A0A8A4ZAJ4_9MICO|nr:TetR/AcrR family transcriptional regulator [Pengzhenrongella sicca]QTE28942.1 TetR/AcrR family transcriptional regulator [Pengzhenrongella sicca]
MSNPPQEQLNAASPQQRSDARRNRAKVLAAARDLAADGDLGLPFNVIARRAGVGVGTVYRQFANPAALLEALILDRLEMLVRETVAVVAEEHDPGIALRRVLQAAFHALLADPALATVLASPRFEYPETTKLGAALAATVTDLLTKARATRQVRPDVSADDLRRLLSGVHHAVRAGEASPELADRYLHVLLDGLAPG